ncbi:MAG: M15 family metallopeptidase [Arcicella sp.]|nr:M15 family metallopeptidase [Arcicella sp.]
MKKTFFASILTILLFLHFPQKSKIPKFSKQSELCEYEQKMRQQGLVNIQEINPSILVNLKYSTTDNFVGKDVYGCITECFIQKRPAEMLSKASDLLQQKHHNYRLLVYDGGRPLSIQKILWNSLTQYSPRQRATYVANPAEGSIHNYGSAVDLTIATADGTPLDMGTKYDYFGELAYPKKESYFLKIKQLNRQQVANRQLLRSVMRSAGYMPIDYEWWHFNAMSRSRAKASYRIIQ